MVNWMKIIDPYKKNLLSDLEKLLLIPLVKNREMAYIETPIG